MEVRAGRLVQRFYHEVWNEADETVAREILHADLRFKASLGPVRTVDELAKATRVHAPSLKRVLRALTTVGVFAEDADGRLRHTSLSETLRKPSGVRPSLGSNAGCALCVAPAW